VKHGRSNGCKYCGIGTAPGARLASELAKRADQLLQELRAALRAADARKGIKIKTTIIESRVLKGMYGPFDFSLRLRLRLADGSRVYRRLEVEVDGRQHFYGYCYGKHYTEQQRCDESKNEAVVGAGRRLVRLHFEDKDDAWEARWAAGGAGVQARGCVGWTGCCLGTCVPHSWRASGQVGTRVCGQAVGRAGRQAGGHAGAGVCMA